MTITQVTPDPRAPLVRLAALLDDGSVEPIHAPDGSGVAAVRGRIGGSPVMAYCTDATMMGGSLGTNEVAHIIQAIDEAVVRRRPVIGLWHSGGARLADGVESMDAVGRMFQAMIRASGRVPQISVVLGPAAGAAAYGPALTDLVIMSEQGKVFITGPEVISMVTGERIDMVGLGGTDVHARKSGVVHVVTDSEAEAYLHARRITGLLSRHGDFNIEEAADEDHDLIGLLPDRPRRAYDVRPLLRRILDGGGDALEELQAKWAPNMVVGLGRLGGRSIGVVANNPLRKGGCLDSLSAEKAARFVRMCDAFGLPLLVVVDVPGYLPGVGQEWEGVVRRGAKLLHAFGESVVPRVTLITRKSYGGAYIAMNSRSLGADAVFAWPEAEVAVMAAEPAVNVLHRKRLAATPEAERDALRAELVEEHRRIAGGVDRAMSLGVVDEVVTPARTRRRLVEAFSSIPENRGRHGNIPL
ncbi:acyl-CoA carboxylase subunit beta [Sphaerisporangium aureirubrum]|uniref:Acyl-CoA carboxylase subunit beta n=1 Tax=Sphaerisporangium aureirubrum TaxID=1544736 RepID=A0ABW1NN49_9ACTN